MEVEKESNVVVFAGLVAGAGMFVADVLSVVFRVPVDDAASVVAALIGIVIVASEGWRIYGRGFRDVWNCVCQFESSSVVFRVTVGLSLAFIGSRQVLFIPRFLEYGLYLLIVAGLVYFFILAGGFDYESRS